MTGTTSTRYISYVPLEAVKPAVVNAKKHDVEAIARSIERLGFTDCPHVDERTQRLVGGHGRWEALVLLRSGGAATPDGIVVDDDGGWLMPVQRGWSSRNDAEAAAANMAANRLNELGGGYDPRALSTLLEDLNAAAPDLFDLLQFSDEDMDALLVYARDGSDPTPPAATDATTLDVTNEDEGDDLGVDHGMTDVPDGPTHEKVRCPECGWHFRPGDRA